MYRNRAVTARFVLKDSIKYWYTLPFTFPVSAFSIVIKLALGPVPSVDTEESLDLRESSILEDVSVEIALKSVGSFKLLSTC